MKRVLLAASLCCASAAGAQAIVKDMGPGASGRLIRAALARPHVEIRADTGQVTLSRDSTYATTVVVLGGSAIAEGRVNGDVVVVGGDLFLHPRANITGRAITVGGNVMNSTLATVGGQRIAFTGNTFEVTQGASGAELSYREIVDVTVPALTFPGIQGFRIPTYERVSGLSLGWGPALALDSGRYVFDATATYRTHLGEVDPRLVATAALGRRTHLVLDARRATMTNDAWIRGDLMNSLVSILSGGDARNYYRADRADLRLERRYEAPWGSITPFVAGAAERARSVGPGRGAQGSPFSFVNRRDTLNGMLRFNPPIDRGDIVSGLLGGEAEWETPNLVGGATAAVEIAGRAPDDRRFVQTTLDGHLQFPTFGDQSFEFAGHAVLTTGDAAPAQRFAYLGGSNTIVTRDLLSMGGDQLLFVEGIYRIPITRLVLPAVGSPTVGVRYAAGSAGVGRLPTLVQNVGLRLAISFLRVDYAIDPVSRDSRASVSLSLSR